MKKITVCFAAVFCLALCATADSTSLGVDALSGAEYSQNNVGVGDGAGKDIEYSNDNTLIGNRAGMGVEGSSGNVAIGNGALNHAHSVNGTVAIGDGELAYADYNSDTTSINGQQLWISQPANAFSICTTKNDAFTNSVIYYKDGTLTLNASKIETPTGTIGTGGSSYSVDGYDYYVSVNGSDGNDGKHWSRPKKTIGAVWNAAAAVSTQTNFTCAVFAGTHYITRGYSFKELSGANATDWGTGMLAKRVEFVALEGSDKTTLTAPDDNLTAHEEDAKFVNLCVSCGDVWNDTRESYDYFFGSPSINGGSFCYRKQTFRGFKVTNFASRQSGSSSTKVAPCFSGIDFDNCEITGNFLWMSGVYGAVGLGTFTNCYIHDNILYHSGGSGGSRSAIYINTYLYDSKVVEREMERPSGWGGNFYLYDYNFHTRNSVLDYELDDYNTYLYRNVGGASRSFSQATIICGCVSNNFVAPVQVFTNHCTNCLIAYNDGTAPADDCGMGNVYCAWTNTNLNADYVADNLDCITIRTDGRADAGWKDSGLAGRKALKILNERPVLTFTDGVLYCSTGGVVIGTIEVTAVQTATRNATSSMTIRQMNTAGATSTDAEVDTSEVADEIYSGLTTTNYWHYGSN